jgi:hypothetical protein
MKSDRPRKSWRERLAARLHWLAFCVYRPVPPTRDAFSPFLDEAFKGPSLEERRAALESLVRRIERREVDKGEQENDIYSELLRVIVEWAANGKCSIKEVVLWAPALIAACLVTFEPGERARLLARVQADLPVQVAQMAVHGPEAGHA